MIVTSSMGVTEPRYPNIVVSVRVDMTSGEIADGVVKKMLDARVPAAEISEYRYQANLIGSYRAALCWVKVIKEIN
jgi:hypothetical protein